MTNVVAIQHVGELAAAHEFGLRRHRDGGLARAGESGQPQRDAALAQVLFAILAANLVIFVLGFFIDFFEIAFIVIPLLAPVFQKMGIDLVWFGVMVGMNLQTSFLTPPFGFALFYLRSVTPKEVKTTEIYKGVIPFIIIQIIGLILLIRFPQMVNWLL